MYLHTLGRLELEGSSLSRPKPLLLLAYLLLEGPRPRRFLAELFWPEAANPMNSLAVAIAQIRKASPGAIEADEMRAWVNLEGDVPQLQEALKGRSSETLSLYRGAFLEGAELVGWGAELEEWVYAKRESLAGQVQETLIRQAEQAAALGQFAQAAQQAERALRVSGAPEPEPELWLRLYPLLRAGESPLAQTLEQQASDWQIELALSPEAARGQLRQVFVGREDALERLLGLPAGNWAWVRGGRSMGKTALLHQLERLGGGTYWPARSGLPYATLEPLLGSAEQPEGMLLRQLAGLEGRWLLDGWERMDSESRALLEKLHGLGAKARLIISAEGEPPFAAEVRLELGPLSASELAAYPGAYQATGGIPDLVGAWLRGEALETALEGRLARISETGRRVYGALVLLESPNLTNLGVVRKALGLEAAGLAQALETLIAAGLIEPSGVARGREAGLRYVQARPTLEAELSLGLARQMQGSAAYGLFRRAQALWEAQDIPKAERAYREWAQEVLKRGFPSRAAQVLAEAPPSPQVAFLRARALERAGQFREALGVLEGVPQTPETLALRSALLWRLGRPQEAQQAAEAAVEGEGEARAEACNTLGLLGLSKGHFQDAATQFRRAASLWLVLNDQNRRLDALNNLAVARAESGDVVGDAFEEALEVAAENPALRAKVLLNLGQMYERRGESKVAESLYREAIELAEEAGSAGTAARGWNNLGARYHRDGLADEAQKAYQRALALAQQVGERLLLGTVLANLAELTGDVEAFEEALRLLERSGNQAMLKRYQAEYQSFMERSGGNPQT